MELLESGFTSRLGPQIEAHLQHRHSIPAFLAAVTLLLAEDANDENSAA